MQVSYIINDRLAYLPDVNEIYKKFVIDFPKATLVFLAILVVLSAQAGWTQDFSGAGGVERLISLNINGETRRVDALPFGVAF